MKTIAENCAGELVSGAPETLVTGVCTDSRQAQGGDVFVALAGDRFDGHDYWPAARKRGAVALIAEGSRARGLSAEGAVIAVANTRRALGRLAARHRSNFALPVVAVGGSNGKTTTKELLAAVLRQKFKTLWSEASFNNDIGVPLTLLKLEHTHEMAVLEVGTNHPGELAPLVRLVQPRLGVITSIGREHLEFFGDLAGVAEEEGWLAELLPADGTLFVDGDSPCVETLCRRTRAAVVRVGFSAGNDWRAREVRVDETGTAFVVDAADTAAGGEYRLNLLGRHQAVNALLAIAVGAHLGVGRDEIRRGLAGCAPARMRLQVWTVNGVRVLDDAYNANADSVLAALQTLCDLPCAGRRVAVLGDMAELGAQSDAAHAEVGRRAAGLGVSCLFTVGTLARVTAAAARVAGLKSTVEFEDAESAAGAVKDYVKAGDVILLKASRVMRLERIGEALRRAADSGNQC
ncbi:MAG: UDP-N-acetylmuramoyl-tripeptide--D-alanyl-D-alanine ligase [Limisphaerales bacterium]